MIVDRASLRNLEIERAFDGSPSPSLVSVLDHTTTRMGARLLRDWMLAASNQIEEITDLRPDITLQSLEAKAARLMILAAEAGHAVVNLSDGPARVVFPRARAR